MKKTLLLSFVVFGVSAFASSNNHKMTLTQDSNVEGKALKAGDYKVTFDNGMATIKNGKDTIEVPAHEQNETYKYSSTALEYQNDGKLTAVQFGGSHTRLVFDGDNNSMHAGQ